jgi:hypothetical protein
MAFLDLSLGFAGPVLGLVASGAGLGAVFLASALIVLGALVMAWYLLGNELAATRIAADHTA